MECRAPKEALWCLICRRYTHLTANCDHLSGNCQLAKYNGKTCMRGRTVPERDIEEGVRYMDGEYGMQGFKACTHMEAAHEEAKEQVPDFYDRKKNLDHARAARKIQQSLKDQRAYMSTRGTYDPRYDRRTSSMPAPSTRETRQHSYYGNASARTASHDSWNRRDGRGHGSDRDRERQMRFNDRWTPAFEEARNRERERHGDRTPRPSSRSDRGESSEPPPCKRRAYTDGQDNMDENMMLLASALRHGANHIPAQAVQCLPIIQGMAAMSNSVNATQFMQKYGINTEIARASLRYDASGARR